MNFPSPAFWISDNENPRLMVTMWREDGKIWHLAPIEGKELEVFNCDLGPLEEVKK